MNDQQPQPSLRDHIDHGVWKQVGRCVYCYCGAQLYQGQLAVTLAEGPRSSVVRGASEEPLCPRRDHAGILAC